MSARLKKQFDLLAGVVRNDKYTSNVYQVDLDISTISNSSPETHSLGFERICYWLEAIFHDSVLICDDSTVIDPHIETGRRILIIPYEPVDSVINLLLFRKLTAITTDLLNIEEITISSSLGGNLVYCHAADEMVDLFNEAGWWNDSRPIYTSHEAVSKDNNVVALTKHREWTDLKLGTANEENQNKIVPFVIKNDEDK